MKNKGIIKSTICSIAGILIFSIAAYPDDTKTFEACRSKLKAAQKLDLLYDLKWDKGLPPTVVVGPTYETLPFDAREGFALTLNCFFNAGRTDRFTNFELLDYKTHHVVGTFSWGHLSTE